jgi:hypothetical protein
MPSSFQTRTGVFGATQHTPIFKDGTFTASALTDSLSAST